MLRNILVLACSVLALGACHDAASSGGVSGGSRQEIRIVGSSTVFPFAKAVAEHFAISDPDRKAPVAESTGTGGGIEQFCKGIGAATPDIANASRRMKKSEFDNCRRNGVTDIVEIQVGIDGIALAESNKGPRFQLTALDIYKALAANPFGQPQRAHLWSDVNPSLPSIRIGAFGPPTTSGTRDAFASLILEPGCNSDPAIRALKDTAPKRHRAICTDVRTDGVYKEQSENDNLIVQKLGADPNMIGIFGYSYMEANSAKVHGIPINGVAPSYASIADGSYPGHRPLYIYVKKAHIGKIPGIQDYIVEFVNAGAPGGYLVKLGLISEPDAVRASALDAARNLSALDRDDLK